MISRTAIANRAVAFEYSEADSDVKVTGAAFIAKRDSPEYKALLEEEEKLIAQYNKLTDERVAAHDAAEAPLNPKPRTLKEFRKQLGDKLGDVVMHLRPDKDMADYDGAVADLGKAIDLLEGFDKETKPSDSEQEARDKELQEKLTAITAKRDELEKVHFKRNRAQRLAILLKSWDVADSDEPNAPPCPTDAETLESFDTDFLNGLLMAIEKKVSAMRLTR